MTAGPATLTDRPLARNRPVPIAPPSAIVVCWADESWRASTCSLRTAGCCSKRGGVYHRPRHDTRAIPRPLSDPRPPGLREQLLAGRAVARCRVGAGGLHRVVAYPRVAVGPLGRRGRAAARRLRRRDWRRCRRDCGDAKRLGGHRRDRDRSCVRRGSAHGGARRVRVPDHGARVAGAAAARCARSRGSGPQDDAAGRRVCRAHRRADARSCRRRTCASATATGSTSRDWRHSVASAAPTSCSTTTSGPARRRSTCMRWAWTSW